MAKILFLEDTSDLHSIVRESLSPEHQVTCVETTNKAREQIAGHDWDLLLVDVSLGEEDGFEFVRETTELKLIPFIFLTGRVDIADKIKGFELGAQDYVTKPFDARELKVRVNARLKFKNVFPAEEFKNRTFKIEVPLQRAYVIENSDEVALNLTPIEFKLLYYFCANENRVINRDEILTVVWGKNVNVLQRTIDKHISSLRQKLGSVARQIETIPQVGYRYISDQKEI